MAAGAGVIARKFHAALNVSNLERSVAFYSVLLDRPAAKRRTDYAKFELDNPPLVLSLIASPGSIGGNLNHAGLRVSTSEELVAIQKRMEEAGFATTREDNVECCHALQTKFWVNDPDRMLWEVYIFHSDVDEGEDPVRPARLTSIAQNVARERATWEHRIPAPFPASIPSADNSLDEIALEGSVNLILELSDRAAMFAEAFRALRPGGLLRVHGLAGDGPLPVPLPALPGPAAVVQYVPAAAEPMHAMLAAGLVDVRFEKLSAKAHFTVAGVGMREIVLTGRKPGYRPAKLTHRAVYLGPLAQVTDDFGNVFRRGEIVTLNVHDWQVLSRGAAADQFQFFASA